MMLGGCVVFIVQCCDLCYVIAYIHVCSRGKKSTAVGVFSVKEEFFSRCKHKKVRLTIITVVSVMYSLN